MTVDRFGRIVLPKGIRDQLGLEPGSVLDATPHERGIVLVPRSEEPLLREENDVLVFAGAAEGDLVAAARRVREGRSATVAKRRS